MENYSPIRACTITNRNGNIEVVRFHGWGLSCNIALDYGNEPVGAASQTVAIIEHDNGKCELIEVERIKFNIENITN